MDTVDGLVLVGLVGRFYNYTDSRLLRIIAIHFLFRLSASRWLLATAMMRAIPVSGNSEQRRQSTVVLQLSSC